MQAKASAAGATATGKMDAGFVVFLGKESGK